MAHEITITQVPTPAWGKTTHDAKLSCEHGENTWTVYGDPAARLAMARSMAPAHRNLCHCQCDVAPVVEATP